MEQQKHTHRIRGREEPKRREFTKSGALFSTVVLTCLVMISFGRVAFAGNLAIDSHVWFASALRTHFSNGIKVAGVRYQLGELPCLPVDITRFNITAQRKDIGLGPAFAIEGSLNVSGIPSPFMAFDGAKGKKYAVHLNGYLISPDGRVVWEQDGSPRGSVWVNADGDSVNFILINAYRESIKGYHVFVFASGDPILSDFSETRVVLGAKRFVLD